MDTNGTTALITGATGRLGSAIALALAGAGCDCICHYHSNEAYADELVKKIDSLGRNAIAVRADLTDPTELHLLFETDLGQPRILINSAAVFSKQPLSKVTFENATGVLSMNLTAPIMLSKLFVENIPTPNQGELIGKIINLVDVGAQRPWANYAVYCASKAGLLAATKSMAKELAPNVCVNAIAPGIITWPKDFADDQKPRQVNFVPLKRAGTGEEITSAILFLIENDYTTGQTINIDGGRSI
ncbi:MAG: SDR family oxidoreductase [Planctomycetes bacterium]|nr:SDR family oxidoreductase [Planctomycetota bacterium]